MENQGKTEQQMNDSFNFAAIGIIGATITLVWVFIYELLH
jgi:hypothetical protein